MYLDSLVPLIYIVLWFSKMRHVDFFLSFSNIWMNGFANCAIVGWNWKETIFSIMLELKRAKSKLKDNDVN